MFAAIQKLEEFLANYQLSTNDCDILEESLLKMAGISKKAPAGFFAADAGVIFSYQNLSSEDVQQLLHFLHTRYQDKTANCYLHQHESDYICMSAEIFTEELLPDLIEFIKNQIAKDAGFVAAYQSLPERSLASLVEEVLSAMAELKQKLISVVKGNDGKEMQFFHTIDQQTFKCATHYINELHQLLTSAPNLIDYPKAYMEFIQALHLVIKGDSLKNLIGTEEFNFIGDEKLKNLEEFKTLEKTLTMLEVAYEKYNPHWRIDCLQHAYKR